MVTNYISNKAKIGENTKIWHFVYVGDDVEIGNNVKIGSLAHIDYNVKIGDDTLIEGLVYIPPLSRIGKNVFIGPGAALTNDPYPPSEKLAGVIIEDNDVPPDTVVVGVPAKPKYSRDEYDKKQSEWKNN
ncbi:MAG: N-acetyltransferase [Marine Group I thaumarchaeote]|nr:N-acetyltransferase [Marine Group I thaumarchaeote]